MSQSHDNLSNLLISCMSVGEVVTPDRVTRSAGKDPSHIILYLLLLYSLRIGCHCTGTGQCRLVTGDEVRPLQPPAPWNLADIGHSPAPKHSIHLVLDNLIQYHLFDIQGFSRQVYNVRMFCLVHSSAACGTGAGVECFVNKLN